MLIATDRVLLLRYSCYLIKESIFDSCICPSKCLDVKILIKDWYSMLTWWFNITESSRKWLFNNDACFVGCWSFIIKWVSEWLCFLAPSPPALTLAALPTPKYLCLFIIYRKIYLNSIVWNIVPIIIKETFENFHASSHRCCFI